MRYRQRHALSPTIIRNTSTVQTLLQTAIAAAITITAVTIHAQTAQDIIGIKTGMTPDQVRPILATRFPGTRIEENLYASSGNGAPQRIAIMVIDHGAKGPSGFEEELLVRFTANTGKVYWVVRNINKQAPSAAYEKAILEKYVTPNNSAPVQRLMHWNWNAAGKPLVTSNPVCLADFQRATPSYVEMGCGLGITALITHGPNPDIASGLRVAMTDSAVLTAEIEAAKRARLNDPKGTAAKPAM